ncbi:putative transcriptional regulator, XRE family [Clostridium beijerinckii NCIMB 8052]|nr:putative transcriptional regulator, XRE family [Clostridium beijerinckii NCIMB 8052]AIU04905.1 XRE family transcriptional regulator [Clostridium beijerinckii ATCC 35702]
MTHMIRICLSRVLGEKRWTQAYLAKKTEIRPNTISELYHELNNRVNLDHIDKICEVVGCDLTDILKYEPNKKKTD